MPPFEVNSSVMNVRVNHTGQITTMIKTRKFPSPQRSLLSFDVLPSLPLTLEATTQKH